MYRLVSILEFWSSIVENGVQVFEAFCLPSRNFDVVMATAVKLSWFRDVRPQTIPLTCDFCYFTICLFPKPFHPTEIIPSLASL
jgi:hypothetical protein